MTTLKTILDDAVAAGHAPGLIAAAITPAGERLAAASGIRAVGSADAMTLDTLCWIASCTKAITSVAALQLVERGLIDLDAPVGKYLPLLAAPQVLVGFDAAEKPITRPAKTPITLRHLLTHTSGLAYNFFSADLTRYLSATGAAMPIDASPDIPLLFEPGTGWQYGIGTDWVGQLIEAVSGQGLDAYVAEHVTGPLGMTDTGFFPPASQSHRRAAIHTRREGGGFDLAAFPIPTAPYPSMGGGGLHSTVGDYLTFLSAIMGGGQAPGGARILKPETVAAMGANHTGEIGRETSLPPCPISPWIFRPCPAWPSGSASASCATRRPFPAAGRQGRWPGRASPIATIGPIRPPARRGYCSRNCSRSPIRRYWTRSRRWSARSTRLRLCGRTPLNPARVVRSRRGVRPA